jgi:hypothetical protein
LPRSPLAVKATAERFGDPRSAVPPEKTMNALGLAERAFEAER